MMRTVQRVRAKGRCPKNPSSLVDLVLPDEYTKTLDGHNFLIFDSGPGEKRILMFATEENLDSLVTSTSIHMDGTFDVAPMLFTQLYTIHGKIPFLPASIFFPFIFPGFNSMCFIFR